jgi:hypothetical protein
MVLKIYHEWPEKLLRGWAKAYRETPEYRFPSDPSAEFFPVDMESAADEIERLRGALTQFVAACDTAPPTSLMIEIGMACNVARAALSRIP